MKAIYKFLSIAVIGFAIASCEKPEVIVEDDVTPEIVARNQMYAKVEGLSDVFTWKSADVLQVTAGGETVDFQILDDYSLTGAKFEGKELSASEYTISYAVPADDERLNVAFSLEGVDTYKNVVFSKEWAAEHGGELKMSNIIVFELEFPANIMIVDAVKLLLNDVEYVHEYDHLDVSALKNNLKVYFALPAESLEIGAEQIIKLSIDSGNDSWMHIQTGEAKVFDGGVYSLGVKATAWEDNFSGKGSKYDPITITNKAELLDVKNHVSDARKMYFVLGADVDLEGEEWTPICKSEMIDFDGGNHTISNLKVTADVSYPSFVGVLNGSVRNLKFVNPVVENAASAKPTAIVASLAGVNGAAVLENIEVVGGSLKVTASTASSAGFLAAELANAEVSNCSVAGTLEHKGYSAELNVGGFIGNVQSSSISNCSSDVDVTISSLSRVVSAFIGAVRSESEITDCSSTGDLNAAIVRYSGGFIGYVCDKLLLRNCTCTGDMSGFSDNCGGMVGCIRTKGPSTLENCHYQGKIVNDVTNRAAGGTADNIGGIVGSVLVPVTLTKCTSKADIILGFEDDQVGGLIGLVDSGATGILVEKSSFSGTISSSTNRSVYGGLIGSMKAAGVVRNCSVSGTMTGANHSVGGVIGTTFNVDIKVLDCWSDMVFSQCGHGIGGIVGRAENNTNSEQGQKLNYNTTVSGCIYWATTMSSYRKPINPAKNHSSAAIVGKTVEHNTLQNCYRHPDFMMDYYGGAQEAYNAPFDQENCDAQTALTFNYSAKYYTPYHGKAAAAGATASSVAKTLGWDQTAWDLSADTPALL